MWESIDQPVHFGESVTFGEEEWANIGDLAERRFVGRCDCGWSYWAEDEIEAETAAIDHAVTEDAKVSS